MEIFRLFGRILVDNSKANEELDDTEKKAQETADAFTEMANEAGMMAGAVAAAAATFVAGIGVQAVRAADELKKSMNTLQAQTGASNEEMVKYEESIMKLYKANTGQGFEDIARSLSEVARTTGLSGEELEKTTTNAIALRDTFEFEVNETARTANSLMKQFGITSKDAYEIMAQSAQQGANKNGDLLDTLNEYAPMFKSAGYTAAEFGNILIQGAKDGAFSIDKVGDAVKESNIRLKEESDTSRNAVEALGLNYDEVLRNFNAGGKTAAQAYNAVVTGISKITDETKKNAVSVALFGGPYEDLGQTIMKTLTNAGQHIDLTKDKLGEINKVKYDSPLEALAGLGRQLNASFFIPLGKKIMPKLNELIAWINSNAPEIEKKFGGAVDKLAGFFNSLGDGILFVMKNFKHFMPIIAGVTGMIVAQFVIGTLIPLYNTWRAAVVGLTIAQGFLKTVMMVSPFGWIAMGIGLVIAGVVAMIVYWDEIVAAAKATWGWLTSFFKTKIGMIVAIMGGPITWAIAIIANWKKIKAAAIATWDYIVNFFRGRFGKIAALFLGPIGIGLLLIANWKKVKERAIAIWNAVTIYFSGFRDKSSGIFTNLRDKIAGVWTSIKSAATIAWNAISDFFKTKIGKIVAILGGPITAGIMIVQNWQKIKTRAIEIWGAVVTYFTSVRDKISGVFKGISDTVKSVFSSLWEFVKKPINLVIKGLNVFLKAYKGIIDKVAGFVNSLPSINLPAVLGGKIGFPKFPKIEFKDIPQLAVGGLIEKAGTALVGEAGPELLSLPRGAQVTPLDKAGQSIVININDAKVFDTRDGERLGELIVKSLKLKGIIPRGV